MLLFAETCEAVAATTKKLEKVAIVAAYLAEVSTKISMTEAATAAIFLSGSPFPAYEKTTLQVGGALLWRVIGELSGKSENELTAVYRRHGDAGSVAAEALPSNSALGSQLTLSAVQRIFREVAAAQGPASKAALLRQLLQQVTPLEVKYVFKIIGGDLRIGLKESLVEEAISRAFEAPFDQVKRANMLLGDIGETLRLAAERKLAEARLRIFHPLDLMLASPVESAEEALSYFPDASAEPSINFSVEDKYDGIRAQAHVSGGEVRLFSRTREEITDSFPELPPALALLDQDAVLDGEIVAWSPNAKFTAASTVIEAGADPGHALPFSVLQQRLGRKKVSAQLQRAVPVAYAVFDVLYADGHLLLDRPLRDRAKILTALTSDLAIAANNVGAEKSGRPDVDASDRVGTDALVRPPRRSRAIVQEPSQQSFGFAADDLAKSKHNLAEDDLAPAQLLRAPSSAATSSEDIEALFAAAQARGNEGLMIKDLNSPYTPGRRGKSWLKMKRELATLDAVVTAVEYGHGKRIKVLSDYTFAVWDGDRLVNIGKAYSGLTDAEIAEMTPWFIAHKTAENGLRLEVEPSIVLEVAFNNMMRSTRHESGYSLRFPRILRLRPDKRPEDADTIAAVEEIFQRQNLRTPMIDQTKD